jgi:hypothetical protein
MGDVRIVQVSFCAYLRTRVPETDIFSSISGIWNQKTVLIARTAFVTTAIRTVMCSLQWLQLLLLPVYARQQLSYRSSLRLRLPLSLQLHWQ